MPSSRSNIADVGNSVLDLSGVATIRHRVHAMASFRDGPQLYDLRAWGTQT